MSASKSFWVLVILTILGFVLRFYKLGEVPSGLYLDEAAQGYSAYSILKTGKDEFGMPFPAAFRSFNDFKTPVYIYLIVPLIPIFGLSSFTIRFPSMLFSVLSLPLLYYLILILTDRSKRSRLIALSSVLLLTISPWHILFGRTNFECNVALFLLLFGYFLFVKSLKKPIFLVPSAIFFAIALPAYHSERLIVPIILIYLFLKHRLPLTSPKFLRFTILGLLIGLVISIPTLKIINTPGFSARLSTLGIFDKGGGFQEFLSLYVSYFSPRSLFWLGDSGPRSSFPELSVMYIWQLPLYLLGLFLLFRQKTNQNLRDFVILLLLVSPIPASLTRDPFSTIRSLPLVIPMSIICSFSVVYIYEKLRPKILFGIIFIFILTYSMLRLHSSVFLMNEYYRSSYWDYGWEEVADTIKNELDPDLPIIVDNARAEPYSQLLVFLLPEPSTYQGENFEVSNQDYYQYMGRNTTKKIGRITTRGISWTEDKKTEQYFIGDALAISHQQIRDNNLILIKEIFYPDGSPAYRIVKTQP